MPSLMSAEAFWQHGSPPLRHSQVCVWIELLVLLAWMCCLGSVSGWTVALIVPGAGDEAASAVQLPELLEVDWSSWRLEGGLLRTRSLDVLRNS